MILLRRNLINDEHIVDNKALPMTADFSFIDGAGLTNSASVVVNRVIDSEVITAFPHLRKGQFFPQGSRWQSAGNPLKKV